MERLENRVIKAKIITGGAIGQSIYIPQIKLTASETKLPFTLSRTQFPIKLALAMTINKSQGQTFIKVGISFLHATFTHGQLYVAFSRVKSESQLIVHLKTNQTPTENVVFKQIFQQFT